MSANTSVVKRRFDLTVDAIVFAQSATPLLDSTGGFILDEDGDEIFDETGTGAYGNGLRVSARRFDLTADARE